MSLKVLVLKCVTVVENKGGGCRKSYGVTVVENGGGGVQRAQCNCRRKKNKGGCRQSVQLSSIKEGRGRQSVYSNCRRKRRWRSPKSQKTRRWRLPKCVTVVKKKGRISVVKNDGGGRQSVQLAQSVVVFELLRQRLLRVSLLFVNRRVPGQAALLPTCTT